ncbi:uroporphyrinogen-III synthase [Cognatiluteimonas weifangensis]|uniref:Uroporphyrinogen-III synthase n=1 Tax=Cognatiluteimonas weifangensis TaxID=2303539 RepID=A0A372DPL7_9GAMM|nr:uroporphyrinogen-III synthase [Luteimonas weifangensis]RFP61496.1 uroporphyrinogen-III synthase [Luteimonas weifangensis]
MDLPLAGCYVISLRPVGAHAALRRAAAARGARLLALSPWRLQAHDDTATRAALAQALAAPRVLFTSPAAVRAAARLQALAEVRGRQWFAVGAGTAAALRRAGAAPVLAPTRMDSEGLLALPGLQALAGTAVGLVTAPGGRGELAPALQRRGAQVWRADVYERVAIAPAPRAQAALRALTAPAWLALSSGAALDSVLTTLPADAVAGLRRAAVVAASARLAQLARDHGFDRIVVAASARPRDLLAAAAAAHPLA